MPEDRGLLIGNKKPESKSAEFANSRAYVIGINSYGNGIPQLRTAVADAERLGELLREFHGYEVQSLPRDGAPTLSNLRNLLQGMQQEVGPNDRVVFYFAGHGIALDGEDGPEGYLVPEDASREDRTSFLPMVELNETISKLPCRHFLLILDCCFAGAFRWSSTRDLSPLPSVIHRERYERYIQDPAWQVLTSAAYDQKALDVLSGSTIGQRVETGRHSPFAEALFRALEGEADLIPRGKNGQPGGDGVITATELYLYLRESVETATVERKMRQTPGLWPLKKHDKGEYILLAPGHDLNLPPAPELNYDNNPYRGLQSFDEKHSRLFFGREREIDDLQKLVSSQSLTVVLGASGTGKSSLVKAGLLPCLRSAATKTKWLVLPAIRVGSSPLGTLASLLLPGEASSDNSDGLLEDFRTNENAFANRVKKWEEANPDASHLLLAVDQFEELVTLCKDTNERELFIAQLANAISLSPNRFRLILTLRTDFEPQFADSTLKTHWMNGRYIVPPMSTDDLRQAIEGPASIRVLYLKPSSLIDLLVDEVIQTPGALPLLSFTMSELYVRYIERQGDDRCLTLADYEELGGVAGSLRSRASRLYDGLDNESQVTLKRIMLRMVSADGGNTARRRVPKSELEYPSPDENVRVATVLKMLSDARLVVEGKERDDAPYVEPAHDELIRGWDKLLAWMRDEQEELVLRSLLTPATNDWLTNPKATWHANPRLLLLRRVAASKDNWLNAKENDFVNRSVNKKRWNVIILSTLASTAIAIVAIFGLLNWQNANRVFVSYLLLKSQQIYSEDPLVGMALALEAQAYDVDNRKVRPTDENLWAMASNYLLTKRTGVDNVVEVPGCSYCIIDFESQPAELRDKFSGALISQLQGRLNPDYSQQSSLSVCFDDTSNPSRFIAPYDDRRADLYIVSPPKRLVSFGEDIDLIEYNSKVIFVAGAEKRDIYLFRDGSHVGLTKKTKDVTVELKKSSEYFEVRYDSSVVSMSPSTELRRAADGAVIWSSEGNPKLFYPHCKGSQFLVDYGDSKIEVRELGSGGVIMPKELISGYLVVSDSLCVIRRTGGKSELRSLIDGRTIFEDVESAKVAESKGIDGRQQFVAVSYFSGKMELIRTKDYSRFCDLSGEVQDIALDKDRGLLSINYTGNIASDAVRLSDGVRVTSDTLSHQSNDDATLGEADLRKVPYIEKADEASENSTFFFSASSKSPVDLGPNVHNYAFNAAKTHFIISYKRGFNELSRPPSELRSGIDGSLLNEFPSEVLGVGLRFNDNASEESFCWDPSGQYFCLEPEKKLTRTGSCQLRCLPNGEEVFPGNGMFEILLNPKNPLISGFALVKRSHEKSELWCLAPTPHKLTEFGNKPEFLDFSSSGRLWIKERGELTLIDTEWAMATPMSRSQMGVSDLRKLLLSFPLSPKRFDSTRLDPLMQGYKCKVCK